MNLEKILAAEKEATRFLERAKAARERAKNDHFFFFGCKESASLKRQSMELSNALVALRKPM